MSSKNGHAPAKGNGKEDVKPSHLELLANKAKTATRLADTIEIHHEQAYLKAADTHLKGEDGLHDYSRLKDKDVRDKFAEEMTSFYVDKARAYFKIDKDHKLDDMQTDLIMQAYAGITRSALKERLKQLRHRFTLEEFKPLVAEIKQEVRQKLNTSITSDLKEENIDSMVEEMGLQKEIDPNKLPLEEAKLMALNYIANDSHVPKNFYEGKVYHRKPEPAKAGAGHGHK